MNTPETDANLIDIGHPLAKPDTVAADFARKLERERDEARRELTNCKSHFAIHDEKELNETVHMAVLHALAERDQLRKVADELAKCLQSTYQRSTTILQCASVFSLDGYNNLPHVIARNEKHD